MRRSLKTSPTSAEVATLNRDMLATVKYLRAVPWTDVNIMNLPEEDQCKISQVCLSYRLIASTSTISDLLPQDLIASITFIKPFSYQWTLPLAFDARAIFFDNMQGVHKIWLAWIIPRRVIELAQICHPENTGWKEVYLTAHAHYESTPLPCLDYGNISNLVRLLSPALHCVALCSSSASTQLFGYQMFQSFCTWPTIPRPCL